MKTTKINWCDCTFNPWWGCSPVSPGCANCYAKSLNNPLKKCCDEDGNADFTNRVRTAQSNWNSVLKLEKESNGSTQTRPRIFCGSMCDWLDDEVPIQWTSDLLDLIRLTHNLCWMLLTKRPENWRKRIGAAADIHEGESGAQNWAEFKFCADWLNGEFPTNVCVGTTVENHEMANKRIKELLKIHAKMHFLSCEPLLSKVGTYQVQFDRFTTMNVLSGNGITSRGGFRGQSYPNAFCKAVDWVICGCESGPNRRPMQQEWAESIRDQCKDTGTPFFMKQMEINGEVTTDITQFPAHLQVREFPKIWDLEGINRV